MLSRALLDPMIGEFDEVLLLIDEPEIEIRKKIEAFYKNAHNEDLLLFYFSGHGKLNDDSILHLIVKTSEDDSISSTSISCDFVRQRMNSSFAKKQVLVLDCCYSGAFVQGIKGGSETVTRDTFSNFDGEESIGKVIITSSGYLPSFDGSQFEISRDSGLSLFTHYLVEGLTTGRADSNRDGTITTDEWYNYARIEMRKLTKQQTPKFWDLGREGRFFTIAKSSIAQSMLPIEGVNKADWLNFYDSVNRFIKSELPTIIKDKVEVLTDPIAIILTDHTVDAFIRPKLYEWRNGKYSNLYEVGRDLKNDFDNWIKTDEIQAIFEDKFLDWFATVQEEIKVRLGDLLKTHKIPVSAPDITVQENLVKERRIVLGDLQFNQFYFVIQGVIFTAIFAYLSWVLIAAYVAVWAPGWPVFVPIVAAFAASGSVAKWGWRVTGSAIERVPFPKASRHKLFTEKGIEGACSKAREEIRKAITEILSKEDAQLSKFVNYVGRELDRDLREKLLETKIVSD